LWKPSQSDWCWPGKALEAARLYLFPMKAKNRRYEPLQQR
jgi:hypothetical protein